MDCVWLFPLIQKPPPCDQLQVLNGVQHRRILIVFAPLKKKIGSKKMEKWDSVGLKKKKSLPFIFTTSVFKMGDKGSDKHDLFILRWEFPTVAALSDWKHLGLILNLCWIKWGVFVVFVCFLNCYKKLMCLQCLLKQPSWHNGAPLWRLGQDKTHNYLQHFTLWAEGFSPLLFKGNPQCLETIFIICLQGCTS